MYEFTHFFVFPQLISGMEFIPQFFLRKDRVDFLMTDIVDQNSVGMLSSSGFREEVVFRNALAVSQRSLTNQAELVVHYKIRVIAF
jgi:hypothetical protein